MAAENPRPSSARPENEHVTEYCILRTPFPNPSGDPYRYSNSDPSIPSIVSAIEITSFGVNLRTATKGEVDTEKIIRETKKKSGISDQEAIEKAFKRDPLNKKYSEKFQERANELGGFGIMDALQIMFNDGWELATNPFASEMATFFLLKRSK